MSGNEQLKGVAGPPRENFLLVFARFVRYSFVAGGPSDCAAVVVAGELTARCHV